MKKDIKDLRYIIRNGQRDLNVLLRRGNLGKYQSYPIENLGSVAPLDPKQRNQITSSPSKFKEENDGFRKVFPSKQSLYRQAARDQEVLVREFKSFIDRFDGPNQ